MRGLLSWKEVHIQIYALLILYEYTILIQYCIFDMMDTFYLVLKYNITMVLHAPPPLRGAWPPIILKPPLEKIKRGGG